MSKKIPKPSKKSSKPLAGVKHTKEDAKPSPASKRGVVNEKDWKPVGDELPGVMVGTEHDEEGKWYSIVLVNGAYFGTTAKSDHNAFVDGMKKMSDKLTEDLKSEIEELKARNAKLSKKYKALKKEKGHKSSDKDDEKAAA